MPPPQLRYPEWFLKNIVDKGLMKKLGERIAIAYDDLFEEVVYRAHHNSFKIVFADVFYKDFLVIAKACGMKKNFWRYLPEGSAVRYMIERNKKFDRYLRKKKRRLVGDIRWVFEFFLSQLSFWYVTVKAFHDIWSRVVFKNYRIVGPLGWREAITVYVIDDFVSCYLNSQGRCIRKSWRKKYNEYVKITEQ